MEITRTFVISDIHAIMKHILIFTYLEAIMSSL